MRVKKITAKLLKKVSGSSYMSKNVTILRWYSFRFLAVRLRENVVILGQLDALNFSVRLYSGKLYFPQFFPNKNIFCFFFSDQLD